MKRLLCCLLLLALFTGLVGCSTDTYSEDSTLTEFKLKNVESITLSGPGHALPTVTYTSVEPIEVVITSESNQNTYTNLVELVTGDRLDTCPTSAFGSCYIKYSITEGENIKEIKVYPAYDGSNYVCLYSLNPAHAEYLLLDDASMKTIVNILESNQIQVTY